MIDVPALDAAPADLATVRPDEAFWDLVRAEEEWWRDEFDAIIAAEFPGPAEGGRAARPSRPGVRPPAHRRPRGAEQPPRGPGGVPAPRVARQRGPPA